MKTFKVITNIQVYSVDECEVLKKRLIDAAKEASMRAYAPYSNFQVGAAVLLSNGEIATGNNQENAAYPSGLCAERVALFHANSQNPDSAIKSIAIAAYNKGKFTDAPCTPCGSCRQTLLEVESRYGSPVNIIMYGTDIIYEVASINDLLPLSFGQTALE